MNKPAKFAIYVLYFFCVMELFSRIYLFGWNTFSWKRTNSFNYLSLTGYSKAADDRDIIFDLKPNLDEIYKFKEFKTNTQGLRDKEYSVIPQDNSFRVVVVGDSFTMGAGVNVEDVYHSVLEKRINEEGQNGLVEFINFGVGGYDPVQYMNTLKRKALKYKPDLIMVGLCGPLDNGFHDDEYFSKPWKMPEKSFRHRTPFLKSWFRRIVRQLWRDVLAKSNSAKEPTAKEIKVREIDEKEKLKKIHSLFRGLNSISKEYDIPVSVVVLNHYNRLLDAYSSIEKVRELAMAEKLFFVDTGRRFIESKDLQNRVLNLCDRHPDEKAHKVFAEIIYGYLTEHNIFKSQDEDSLDLLNISLNEQKNAEVIIQTKNNEDIGK